MSLKNKKSSHGNNILLYMLFIYVLISALFILCYLYNYIHAMVYKKGYGDAYKDIINLSLKPEACQGFTLSIENEPPVVLLNTNCFQSSSPQIEWDGALDPEDDPATFLHLQR